MGKDMSGARYVTEHIPSDISQVWTGPNIYSESITFEDIQKWREYTGKTKPFLWDNTTLVERDGKPSIGYYVLYHLLKDTYSKDFEPPVEGVFHNNNIYTKDAYVGLLDLSNYLWNPKAYDPDSSWRRCQNLVRGRISR